MVSSVAFAAADALGVVFDETTATATVPSAGIYHVDFSVAISRSLTAGSVTAWIRRNSDDSLRYGSTTFVPAATGHAQFGSLSATFHLDAQDWVDVQLLQTSGSSVQVGGVDVAPTTLALTLSVPQFGS